MLDETATTETAGFDTGTMIGEDGNFNDTGRGFLATSLGEGFEDFKGFDKYNNLPDLLKGTANTSKMVGQKQEGMIKLPTADSTPEEIAAYRESVGVPVSADKYELTRRELAEGGEFDAAGTEMFKGVFHEAGLDQTQAQKLTTAFDAYEDALITKQAEQRVTDAKAANEAFDTKHGTEAEKVRRLAGEAIVALNFSPVIEQLEKAHPGIGNDPAILDWIHGDVIPKMLPGQFKEGGSPVFEAAKKGLSGIYNHKTSQEQLQKAK